MNISIRRLTSLDIPSAMALSSLAGWNQTESDWALLLKLRPEGCFGLECDGRIVATTTLVCYDDRLAWLGMVLTHPDYRRRGFARQLVERALRLAGSIPIRSVMLDATDQGRPLYESFGFRTEQAIERWSVVSRVAANAATGAPAANLDLALDREAFGADRSQLLHLLTDSAQMFTAEDGFVFSRPGARAWLMGPCVTRSAGSAQTLIEHCISRRAGRWFWDLLPSNRDAVRLATRLGFKPDRALVRMLRGNAVRQNASMIYAGGGFEFG